MNSSSKSIPVLFITFLFFICAENVFGCTCQDVLPTCALYNEADAVFVGKIQNITSAMGEDNAGITLGTVGSISSWGPSGLIAVHFKVEKPFKGVEGETIKALTYQGTTCDLGVKKGQRWIIYATRDKESGFLTFGACGGNRRIEKNDEDISFLDKYIKGETKPLILGKLGKDFFPSNLTHNAVVTVEGNGVNLSTEKLIGYGNYGLGTLFQFELPQSGKYNVKITMPFSAQFFPNVEPLVKVAPTEMETTFTYEAEVAENRCDYKNISVAPLDLKATAVIEGHFIKKSSETKLDSYAPELCKVKETEVETLKTCSSYLRFRDETFSFNGLREDEYIIVLNRKNVPTLEEPYLKTYLPGTKDFSQAQRIILNQGQKIENLIFNLPEKLMQTNIRGNVVLKNEKPLPDFLDKSARMHLPFGFMTPQREKISIIFAATSLELIPAQRNPKPLTNKGIFRFRLLLDMNIF